MTKRADAFRKLHQSGCFVMPNPWDAGSAWMLARLGFPAVATTSAGFAWSMGRPDNGVSVDEALQHMRAIAQAVDVPVNADFEGAFAVEPDAVAKNVALAAATGVAGLSVEDSTGNAESPLFDFELSVARIAAARRAIDRTGTGVLLTGRSEGFVVGRPDLEETIRRLKAYGEAGAECLYAPRINDLSALARIVDAVAPRPVNALVGSDFATVAQVAETGARRISVGGTLARAAWAGFLEAANEIAERGTFTAFARAVPFADLDGAFPARGRRSE